MEYSLKTINKKYKADLENFKYALDQHAIVAITDRKGKIIYANEKFCEVSKYTKNELLGKNHRILNSKYHPTEFFQNLWQTITNGKIWKGDIRNRAKDGSLYWVNTTIVPLLGPDNKPEQFIAIRALITDKKELEEENKKIINELKNTNQELSEFAHIVSHDLKAPLRGIISLAEWLHEDHSKNLDEQAMEYVRLINTRAIRLAKLIDGILIYSKTGKRNDSSILIDLHTLLETIIEDLTIPENISIEILSKLPVIKINSFKARQLFQNLISNAIKYMDKPKGIIKISAQQEDIHWHFVITDNGMGIDSQYFDKIFGIFQTLNNTNEAESTGIGLAIVKKIVESYNGKIWVDSQIGIGTNFHFTLPAIST